MEYLLTSLTFLYISVKEIQVPHADAANPESARPRRAWELWSTEDKNLFFEALFEVFIYADVFP